MSKYIIGIDEAGRGPLAGPIVAAGVVSRGLKKEARILDLVDDSKKLSLKRREGLFKPIVKNFTWSVSILDNRFIDKYGIQVANTLIFQEVADELLAQLNKPTKILADYLAGGDRSLRQIEFHKQGESKFKEIAAASVLAKVFRDRLMMGIDKEVPHYDFWLHKGYGTKRHYEILNKYGPSPIHRLSFLKNLK